MRLARFWMAQAGRAPWYEEHVRSVSLQMRLASRRWPPERFFPAPLDCTPVECLTCLTLVLALGNLYFQRRQDQTQVTSMDSLASPLLSCKILGKLFTYSEPWFLPQQNKNSNHTNFTEFALRNKSNNGCEALRTVFIAEQGHGSHWLLCCLSNGPLRPFFSFCGKT